MGGGADKVIVAVKAEKVISKTALAWALTHVGHPGDCVTLLAVFSAIKTGNSLLLKTVFWISQNYVVDHGKPPTPQNSKNDCEYAPFDQDIRKDKYELKETPKKGYLVNSSIRDAVSLGKTSSTLPPLCSLCQHKTPVFGNPPKQFSYKELEDATDAFSDINLLEEGGFGVVHRGVLRDGQVVAVKQLKFVLSCAQQGNVVLLIGYCIEGNARVLLYEYIRYNSLDFRLHGVHFCYFMLLISNISTALFNLVDLTFSLTLLDCESRLKIAIGATRGLRYLHEDCRVGCIVHRDLRPNNILLTHDFEPLVLKTDPGILKHILQKQRSLSRERSYFLI
ncbi:inactive protein kinase [Pyrus ussuriensis x Pyrus communis]|uniref:Inactive protein kinase n=1 Tax=Pyrus ussuriensis x Pyrus communis TaxID=2448454 RepID=A0A5N5GYN8_9ROSA|nr:inactive protein kinase [Pyrus ussuriensis x Pyrus communis]